MGCTNKVSYNVGLKQLKVILNVATGLKGITESTKRIQINNLKNALLIKYDHPPPPPPIKIWDFKNRKQVKGRK